MIPRCPGINPVMLNLPIEAGVSSRLLAVGAHGARSWVLAATIALIGTCCFTTPALASVSHNVKDYGVRGDGRSVETALIQGAIDSCALDGGCTLVFPAGRYRSGTLFLRDSVTLHLTPGAVLATSGNADDYPAPALIYGKGVDTVAITGPGEVQAGPVPPPDEITVTNPGSRLVSLVMFENCTNVRIQGVRFRRSPALTISMRVVDSAWVENVSIDNALFAPNTGGIVIDSSSRVTIRGLHFRGGGEGIAVQTSLVDGVSPASEHIAVSDSTLESGSIAFKIGTQTHGDIRNIVVNNLVITRSQGGIGIFARDGGAVENLQFSNTVIHTRKVRKGTAEWPLLLDLKRRADDTAASRVQGIRFHNTQMQSGGKILLSGMPGEPIRNLQVDGLTFNPSLPDQTNLRSQRPWRSPVDAVVGEDTMAAAIVAGYLADCTFRDVRIHWATEERSREGHALFLHSSDGVSLDAWHARQAMTGGDLAAIYLRGARNVAIRNSTALPQTGIWVQVERMRKQDVFMSGNSLSSAYRELVVAK